MGIVQSIRRLWRGLPHAPDSVLDFDDDGFRRAAPEPFAVRWDEIERISGYKTDLWTVDEIRIQVDLASGEIVVFSEESPGFPALMVEIERRFPDTADWFARIALPATAAAGTLLLHQREVPARPATALDD